MKKSTKLNDVKAKFTDTKRLGKFDKDEKPRTKDEGFKENQALKKKKRVVELRCSQRKIKTKESSAVQRWPESGPLHRLWAVSGLTRILEHPPTQYTKFSKIWKKSKISKCRFLKRVQYHLFVRNIVKREDS